MPLHDVEMMEGRLAGSDYSLNATQSTEELFTLHANLGEGFYYFLAYCLLSVASAQLMTYGGENNGARPQLTQR